MFVSQSGKVRRMDLIICPFEEYPFCLLGWTGSKQYLRFLRQHAGNCNMYLNSHRQECSKCTCLKSANAAINRDDFKLTFTTYRQPDLKLLLPAVLCLHQQLPRPLVFAISVWSAMLHCRKGKCSREEGIAALCFVDEGLYIVFNFWEGRVLITQSILQL